ncbi:MAG: GTP 3',8-cyclase MoaA [Staphylothermus sp.]|nr:GTP 3',8-cyclase MoaA [Staphylothermus sp.]
MFIDRYGRPVDQMRISVTLRCNHSCIFCHREGINGMEHRELTADDWGFVAKVSVKNDIKYYKLTGGEPLIRNDIVEIVHNIRKAGGTVSITTNGSLLSIYARRLAEEKIDHINVSLHSLKNDIFRKITRGNLERVLEGIDTALNYGIKLKLDYVVLTYNSNEFIDIINFAESKGIDLNIIELIPLGLSKNEYYKLHLPLDKIIEYLEKESVAKKVREFQTRPVYIMSSGIKITVIKGWCNPELCMRCTRIRMTPDGKIKTCLFRNDQLVDAWREIKNRDEKGFEKALKKAVELREPFFKAKNNCIYLR